MNYGVPKAVTSLNATSLYTWKSQIMVTDQLHQHHLRGLKKKGALGTYTTPIKPESLTFGKQEYACIYKSLLSLKTAAWWSLTA